MGARRRRYRTFRAHPVIALLLLDHRRDPIFVNLRDAQQLRGAREVGVRK